MLVPLPKVCAVVPHIALPVEVHTALFGSPKVINVDVAEAKHTASMVPPLPYPNMATPGPLPSTVPPVTAQLVAVDEHAALVVAYVVVGCGTSSPIVPENSNVCTGDAVPNPSDDVIAVPVISSAAEPPIEVPAELNCMLPLDPPGEPPPPEHPLVVAPPVESVHSVAPVPLTVPAVMILVSAVPCTPVKD